MDWSPQIVVVAEDDSSVATSVTALKKFNIDPALGSSVFVTTITDVIGFLSFLGIGSIFFLN